MASLDAEESKSLDEADVLAKTNHFQVRKNGKGSRQVEVQTHEPNLIDFQPYYDSLLQDNLVFEIQFLQAASALI